MRLSSEALSMALALALGLTGCGEPSDEVPKLGATVEQETLPTPSILALWVHGLDPAALERIGSQSGLVPALSDLAARGSRMTSSYSVALDTESAAACLWNGTWPHERIDAPAPPLASELATRILAAGFEPSSGGGQSGELVSSVAAWLAASTLPESSPTLALIEVDMRSEAGSQALEAALASLAAGLDASPSSNRLILITGARSDALGLREMWLRAPALFVWPGVIPAAEGRPQLTNTLDLRQTLLEFAGAGPDPDAPGMSFARLLRRRRQVWRAYVCAQGLDGGQWRPWIRTAEWSIVPGRGGRASLFWLVSDPEESIDMGGRPEVAAMERQMSAILDAWVAESRYEP